jgi:hypothetical protein
MLQMAAIIEDGQWKKDNMKNVVRFLAFPLGLESYICGDVDKKGKQNFKRQIEYLRQVTLEAADVVVGTLFCVAQHSSYSVFKPVVVMIDEAARLMETLL